jgi:superfamily II DNA helicase RecQ
MAGKRVEEDSGESKTSESKTSESKTSESKTIKERPPEENAVVSAPPLTDEEAGLYRRLEVWRKAKAAREGKPAYIILTNESLQRIAREKPQTLDALSEIKGIGPVKLERFGEEILAVLQTGAPGREGP